MQFRDVGDSSQPPPPGEESSAAASQPSSQSQATGDSSAPNWNNQYNSSGNNQAWSNAPANTEWGDNNMDLEVFWSTTSFYPL